MAVKITENALNVLAAKTYRGVGRAWIVKNLKGNESINKIVALLNEGAKEYHPITQVEFEKSRIKINASIEKLAHCLDGVVAIGDDDFPPHRGNVKNSDRPVVLFYRGDIRLLSKSNKNVTVIGLITPDKETEILEGEMVSKLVSGGATIISGLALGCDSVAHRQALRSKGKTVAVLPSPLNDILPSQNRQLAEEIYNHEGLLVTEYYELANSRTELIGRYQERDRLQALFSDCVILTASYSKNDDGLDSGSRIAMEYAKNYAIQRAVMYDPTRDGKNPKFDLNRQIISDQVGIFTINRKNMESILKEVTYRPPQQLANPVGQLDLFG